MYVPGGAASVQRLMKSGDALAFVAESFKHCKAIAASGDGVQLLRALPGVKLAGATEAGVVEDQAVVTSGTGALAQAFITAIGQHRCWTRNVEAVPA